jgi:hypothetical protein
VSVFNATGRLVANRDVRPGHGYFRFVLKPGRYKVKLAYNRTVPDYCPQKRAVRVRAKRTIQILFAPACGTY